MSPGRPGEQYERLITGILHRDEPISSRASDQSELLTFLVADIRGYTRFTQQHGDEAAARLTEKFASVVRGIVAQSGGTVFELRGDEALCVFSSPRQCLRAALALQRRFVDETAADPDLPMAVGIGIDAGEAVRSSDGFRGGALNLAARLCGHARAGEVLATPEVTHLAGRIEAVHYDVLDRVVLKGMTERVRPVRVVPDGEDPARQMAALLAAATAAAQPPPAVSWLPRPLANRPRATLAGVLVVLAVVGVVVGFTVSRSGHGPTLGALGESSVGIVDPATGDILDQVRVPGGPTALAAGFGSMWTADTDADTVTRIDITDRRVVRTIDVDDGPSAVAVGFGSVWVVNTISGTVSRIDPATNRAARPIRVGAAPRGVVVADSSMWVTNTGDGTVSRIDPGRAAFAQPVPVGFSPIGIAAGRDIWVANSASNSVTEIDPTTLDSRTVPVGTSPTGVTVIDDKVWVTNNRGSTVTRIPIAGTSDPETSAVGEEPSQIAAVDGHIWLANQATGAIAELDPASGQTRNTVRIGPIPGGIAAGGGKLWVSTTIDPAKHRGGTLNLVGEDIVSVDPLYGPLTGTPHLGATWLLLNGSYDGLLSFAHTTGADSTAIVPDLATTIPTPTNGGRTYTFTLRSGIRWSTGKPVTVFDVQRGIERTLVSGFSALGNQIIGSKTCTSSQCAVSGIAVDAANHTVAITLVRPNGNFINELALVLAVPASTPLTQDDTHPIPATGPYRIARYVPGNMLLLTRNPFFHQWSAAAQPAGFPDAIVWRVDPENATDHNRPALDDVAAGRADWADATDAAPLGTLKARFGDRTWVSLQQYLFGLSLNTRVPPFNNVLARRALAFAIDRRAIRSDWPAPAAITCQFLPPNYSAYRPYCPYTRGGAVASGTWRAPDLPTARRLVRQSHTRGMTVTVTVWYAAQRAAFGHIVDALRELGYDAHLEVYGGKQEYFTHVADSRNKVQAAFYGWIPSDSTAAGLLDLWRCSAYKPADPVHTFNPAGFCNHPFDRLLDRTRQVESTSLAAATQLWARADRFLTDRAPWIPLVTPASADVISTRVRNYARSPVLGMLFGQMRLR